MKQGLLFLAKTWKIGLARTAVVTFVHITYCNKINRYALVCTLVQPTPFFAQLCIRFLLSLLARYFFIEDDTMVGGALHLLSFE